MEKIQEHMKIEREMKKWKNQNKNNSKWNKILPFGLFSAIASLQMCMNDAQTLEEHQQINLQTPCTIGCLLENLCALLQGKITYLETSNDNERAQNQLITPFQVTWTPKNYAKLQIKW